MNRMINRNDLPDTKIGQKFANNDAVTDAVSRGIGKAMREHKLMGRSVVGYRGGKVVHFPPEEIPDYDENGELIEPEADPKS